MSKLVGKRWGSLSKDTRSRLLKSATCIDGQTGNEVNGGECIIDLTDTLSVSGKVINDEIVIDEDAIIYDPTK